MKRARAYPMKVVDLSPGMLLTFAGDGECFSIYGQENRWLRVRLRPRPSRWGKAFGPSTDVTETKVAVYLGTKKDLNIDQPWTDKFVLIDNEVVGVDPSSWRRMKPVE